MEEKKAERKKYTAGNSKVQSGKKCQGCMTARNSLLLSILWHIQFLYLHLCTQKAMRKKWPFTGNLQEFVKGSWYQVYHNETTSWSSFNKSSQANSSKNMLLGKRQWIIWSVWLQVILNQGNMHAGSKPTPANYKAIAGRQMTLILFSRQQMTLSPHCKNEQHISI